MDATNNHTLNLPSHIVNLTNLSGPPAGDGPSCLQKQIADEIEAQTKFMFVRGTEYAKTNRALIIGYEKTIIQQGSYEDAEHEIMDSIAAAKVDHITQNLETPEIIIVLPCTTHGKNVDEDKIQKFAMDVWGVQPMIVGGPRLMESVEERLKHDKIILERMFRLCEMTMKRDKDFGDNLWKQYEEALARYDAGLPTPSMF